MEIGIDSFAAILPDLATANCPRRPIGLADLLEEVADRVGLDVFTRNRGSADHPGGGGKVQNIPSMKGDR
jgi:hypothetical protein